MNIIDLIVDLIIPVLGLFLTVVVVPLIRKNTTKQERQKVENYVRIAVNAAEAIYKERNKGEDKYKYVTARLNELGIKLSEKDLKMLVEAAVYEINKNKVYPIQMEAVELIKDENVEGLRE